MAQLNLSDFLSWAAAFLVRMNRSGIFPVQVTESLINLGLAPVSVKASSLGVQRRLINSL